MKIIEKRIVEQQWYETETTNTGWDSHGWVFKDDYQGILSGWTITELIDYDKFYNPILAIADLTTI